MSASPSPQPLNTATIILPPGISLEGYMVLQGQLVTIAITTAVAFGIVAWDYFALFPDELVLYTDKDAKLYRAPTKILFIILRYSGLLATLPALFFTSAQTRHCQAAVILSQTGACLAVFSSGAIFCFRVCAIWHGNKAVYGLMVVAFATMMSCWVAAATQFNASAGPATPFGSNCQMHPIVSWAPISYGSSVFFDTTVLLLTLAKLPRTMTLKSPIGRQIFRDTVVYFMITAVTNVVVLSIQALGEAHTMLKPAAVPFSTVMTVAMGSRVYLNLKLLQKRRQVEGSERIALSVPALDKNRTTATGGSTPGRLHVQNEYFSPSMESSQYVNTVKSQLTLNDV